MKFILIFLASLSFTLMARAEPSRSHRSALIIGVSDYDAKSGAPSLEGVPFDMKSANRIANAMALQTPTFASFATLKRPKKTSLKHFVNWAKKRKKAVEVSFIFQGMARAI